MLAVADGIIFGCPTHMGGPSWQLKRFADTTIRVWRPTLRRDKPAGGFTNSAGMSGDKFSTLTYFWTLAMQHGMAWIGSGMKPAIAYDKAAPRESLNYIGGYRRGDGHRPAR
jgi:NAD(P)H dehydrogenase (quinone)